MKLLGSASLSLFHELTHTTTYADGFSPVGYHIVAWYWSDPSTNFMNERK